MVIRGTNPTVHTWWHKNAVIAQLAERRHGKAKVISSTLIDGSQGNTHDVRITAKVIARSEGS